jgi:hypothetical protein
VVASAEVLHERVAADDASRGLVALESRHLSPSIGRSHALSRPWSASIRLLAYCTVLWNAAGMNSSTTSHYELSVEARAHPRVDHAFTELAGTI